MDVLYYAVIVAESVLVRHFPSLCLLCTLGIAVSVLFGFTVYGCFYSLPYLAMHTHTHTQTHIDITIPHKDVIHHNWIVTIKHNYP